jgi:hypothetical protein
MLGESLHDCSPGASEFQQTTREPSRLRDRPKSRQPRSAGWDGRSRRRSRCCRNTMSCKAMAASTASGRQPPFGRGCCKRRATRCGALWSSARPADCAISEPSCANIAYLGTWEDLCCRSSRVFKMPRDSSRAAEGAFGHHMAGVAPLPRLAEHRSGCRTAIAFPCRRLAHGAGRSHMKKPMPPHMPRLGHPNGHCNR